MFSKVKMKQWLISLGDWKNLKWLRKHTKFNKDRKYMFHNVHIRTLKGKKKEMCNEVSINYIIPLLHIFIFTC